MAYFSLVTGSRPSRVGMAQGYGPKFFVSFHSTLHILACLFLVVV